MIQWLINLCVRRSGAVAALALLALALGTFGAMHASLDVFPEFVPSQVSIQTEAPGFTPQQVEELITRPIENLVNGATCMLRGKASRSVWRNLVVRCRAAWRRRSYHRWSPARWTC